MLLYQIEVDNNGGYAKLMGAKDIQASIENLAAATGHAIKVLEIAYTDST